MTNIIAMKKFFSSKNINTVFKGMLYIPLILLSFCTAKAPVVDSINWTKIPAQLEINPNLNDDQLLELVQRQSFRYFWDFAHPISGLARDRSNNSFSTKKDVVTIGGSGFGIMAMAVAVERKWISSEEAIKRVTKIVDFLGKAERYYGMWAHWMDGETGKTVPFSLKDNGADIVESAFMFQGLLTVRQYFQGSNPEETTLREKINALWNAADWNHFTKGQSVLYWHWSPTLAFGMNHPIRGYDEGLIAYVLAASSNQHSIDPAVYHQGWAFNRSFINGKEYEGITLPLGMDYGGPLFFAHYSFLGLDPRGLHDQYADYWEQNVSHTLINRAYSVRNPKKYKGYSEKSWGLSASDNHLGYAAHSPLEDLGVISPTATISSFPYTPEYSMEVLKHFYFDKGTKLWGPFGFIDAFNETENWYAKSNLAIDQGPMIIMIENYRTGLLWDLFMSAEEVQKGLKRLGFEQKRVVLEKAG